jgi:hypothetical protein
VEIEPWQPRHETVARSLVAPAQVLSRRSWAGTRIAARLLDLANAVEAADRHEAPR